VFLDPEILHESQLDDDVETPFGISGEPEEMPEVEGDDE